MEDLKAAFACLDSDPDRAHAIANDILNDDPDNAAALHLVAVIQSRAAHHGMALGLWQRVALLKPGKADVWCNLGETLSELGKYADARAAYRRALELRECADYMANMAIAYNEDGQFQEGMRWARRALSQDPGHRNATATLGFSKLALGDWSGWTEFQSSLGTRHRMVRDYAPAWDGGRVGSLIVYGEQGLGDEVMYASCLEDARRCVDHVSIECEHRLEGLFKRSFPWADVYGTRRMPTKEWRREFTAQVPCAGLPAMFRKERDKCPKAPYLVADPERRLMWRSLFKAFGKPVIGLAWTGGNRFTKRVARRVGLEAFRPLIERTDAVFVSLQYEDAQEEIDASGLPVRQFPWATITDDYDDTAALVAELSRVIGIHTSVHHLAGALGVPSTILVPSRPMWNYATGDRLPWYREQIFHRQRQGEAWSDCIKRIQ